jgi:hypothetical protein
MVHFSKYLETKNLENIFIQNIKNKYTIGTDGITTNKYCEITIRL